MSGTSPLPRRRIVWVNHAYAAEEAVRVSPFDRGFLFGDGLFETLRTENGRILYLKDHLERLRAAAVRLRLDDMGPRHRSTLDFHDTAAWRDRCVRLLKENGLERGVARLKILVTRGAVSGVGLPRPVRPTLCILAEPYTPPSVEEYASGWSLCTCRTGWSPPLANMKTLNFLFYLCARQEAMDAGFDETLIYDKDGRVAETATGSLLFLREGRCVLSASRARLPGTAEKRIVDLFREDGWWVGEDNITAGEIPTFEGIWMTNSLVGIMPVRALDGKVVPRLFRDRAARYRGLFFRRGLENHEDRS